MMVRYWSEAYPLMRAELDAWRMRADAIPDAQLRADALTTLDGERLNVAGAALFCALLGSVDRTLLRVLIAFQTAWDYLDTLSERPSADAIANGAQLHLALVDALSPGAPCADWYGLHGAAEDGGYLAALVETCREGCASLPGHVAVLDLARAEAARAAVQGINHAPDAVREAAMQRWAAEQGSHPADVRWFELAAAASSSLAILALIAAAAAATNGPAAAERIRGTYFPWICALSTLLDSLVDEREDVRSGSLSFIGHYSSRTVARERLRIFSRRSFAEARELPGGQLHVVMVAGMVAMYLSKPSAWRGPARPLTLAVLAASSRTVLPLLALLGAWRCVARARPTRQPAAGAVPTPTGQLTPVPPSPQ
jgi:tetraprenyl-beta-curcumene synthase